MINFLPPEAKTVVKREYVIRTIGVWALLLAAVALVVVLLLLPTYVLVVQQLNALATEVVQTENATSTHAYETARTALEKTQTLALQLGVVYAGPTASAVLRGVQEVQTSAITISGFSYERTGTAVEKVEVRGVAATREALTEFSTALERNPLFARATVPVSDLAADRDLSFTLTIALAKNGM